MGRKIFKIKMREWGSGSNPFSSIRVWRGSDPRWVDFEGDAYWQWGPTPVRANGAGVCWSQALHDALEGWHSTVLHQDELLVVHDGHPDFAAVERLWHEAQET